MKRYGKSFIAKRARERGLSLIELLSVVGVLAILMTIAGNVINGTVDGVRQKDAASIVLQRLREARELAVREQVRVRWVFQPQAELAKDIPKDQQPPRQSHAVYVFRVPAGAAQPVISNVTANLRSTNASGVYLPASLPLPETLVGRWEWAEGFGSWSPLGDGLEIRGELLDRWKKEGPEGFVKSTYHKPEWTWREDAWPAALNESARSTFPPDYAQVPFPYVFPRMVMPLWESTRVFDPVRREMVPARELWGEREIEQFAVSDAQAHRTWTLPGIEFRPDGSLAAEWEDSPESLRVEIGKLGAANGSRIAILVDFLDGTARLE